MNMSSDLRTISKKFEASNNVYSFYELAVTIIGYAFFVYVVYLFILLDIFWPAYVVFSLISSLFMVKLFTLLHDCAHESMFSSAFLNVWVGRFISIFMTMPFTSWKEEHNDHHSHVVDIEKMYHGDVPLLTVEQFNSKSKMKKKLYSVYRHPVVFLLVSPFYLFFLKFKISCDVYSKGYLECPYHQYVCSSYLYTSFDIFRLLGNGICICCSCIYWRHDRCRTLLSAA